MNLIGLTSGNASPGLIRDLLLPRFDAVEVVEANPEGWFDLQCWQGFGEDARLRLRVHFIWLPITGWNYVIKPGCRA